MRIPWPRGSAGGLANWAGGFANEWAAMNDEKLDRFARGELSSLESRELARKALEDPELFDELTQTSIARRALSNRLRGKVRWRRIATWAIAASVILGVA